MNYTPPHAPTCSHLHARQPARHARPQLPELTLKLPSTAAHTRVCASFKPFKPAFKPSCWPAIFFPPPAPVQQTSTKTADCRPVFLSCNNYETRPARMVTGSELAQSQHTHTDTESPHSPSPNTHALPTHCTTCHPAPALNVTFYCPRTLLVYA